MLYLAIPTLRARWASFVGVFATVAAAVALITATGVLLESGIRGDVPPERLAGTDIVVAGDQSISERSRQRRRRRDHHHGRHRTGSAAQRDADACVGSVAGCRVGRPRRLVSALPCFVRDGSAVAGPTGDTITRARVVERRPHAVHT